MAAEVERRKSSWGDWRHVVTILITITSALSHQHYPCRYHIVTILITILITITSALSLSLSSFINVYGVCQHHSGSKFKISYSDPFRGVICLWSLGGQWLTRIVSLLLSLSDQYPYNYHIVTITLSLSHCHYHIINIPITITLSLSLSLSLQRFGTLAMWQLLSPSSILITSPSTDLGLDLGVGGNDTQGKCNGASLFPRPALPPNLLSSNFFFSFVQREEWCSANEKQSYLWALSSVAMPTKYPFTRRLQCLNNFASHLQML